ncbi:MAG: hypothetical protein KGI25_02815 [Thaumarchaeota archaeon]|nr:hypothetical protein [Nitrososphaerota archaeon]
MIQKFDLIVIGSGSGLDVANAAAEHGLKVAMRSAEGTIDSLTNTIFIHPALSEVVARAAYSVQ